MGKLKASDYIDYENELAVKFQEAILSLPEKQRLVFNLRYYDELEYEDEDTTYEYDETDEYAPPVKHLNK